MERASPSAVMKQPNMESDDPADGWYAFSNVQKPPVVELQEVVSHEIVHPQEVPQTGMLETLLPRWKYYLSELGNPKQILYTDDMHLIFDMRERLYETRNLVRGAERNHDLLVKLWVADTMEVLNDMEDILVEIIDANRSWLRAELQCSANKPWKLILNLFNKVSRFMHYYRDKEMVSKVRDITVRIQRTFEEAISSGLQSRLSTEDKFEPKNLGRKQYDMLNAIYKGKFGKVKDFLEENPDAISTIFENGQTALHVAITAGQLRIAKELITSNNSANSHHLKIQDESGNTALSLAVRSGMMEIAEYLIEMNKDLLTIPDVRNKLPVQLACRAGHEDMTRYLYRHTPQEFLNEDYGFYLLEECITKKMFDIALHLLYRFPKFAIYKFFMDRSRPIISTLAQTPPPLFRGNQLAFWRRWIYKWIRVKADKGSVLHPSDGVEIFAAQRSGTLVSILPNFLAKQIYDIKLTDVIVHEIIHFICKRLSTLDEDQFKRSGAVEATFAAIENGNPDIVIEITKVNTNIWNHRDFRKRNLLACAVVHRQEEVAQFLYGFNARIGTNKFFTKDRERNNLLHLAAMLAPRSHLDRISGAALQLQSELRWYKAVEGIVPQFFHYQKNRGRYGERTPSQVFADEHEQLLKAAEEWLKKTAESSTVVGALIITIMFAVAFTVPGGNDQNTGFPIFLNKTANSSMVSSPTVPFMVFVASDAISLFAASSSVLMFLRILTSRCAYEDFLKSLPVKLIIGISSLFISIAAMMVAFCVALFIMLQGRLWIIIPVTLFAGIPVIIFALLQFPFLVELYTSTFRPGIFDRKKNKDAEGKGRHG